MEKRNHRSRLLDSKVFWIITSLLASLAIWTYVISTENSDTTQVFRGVPVTIVGEDQLRNNKNLIVTDVDATTVRVEIKGPRRIVDALDAQDLTAQIDVSKLSRAAYASMKYKIVYPGNVDTRNIYEVSYTPETINFTVSMLNTVSIPVRGGFEGKLADGFIAETPVFEPSTITVTGPDAYLKDISYAWVNFGQDVTAESSYTAETPFILMNAEGAPVSTEYLTSSDDFVTATLPILMQKEVLLKIEPVYAAGATSANTKITITPDRVTLAGDSAVLDGLNEIFLDSINLADFRSSYSEVYTIPINNSLRNLTGVTEAKVDVEITGLSTSTYNVKNINVINAPDNCTVSIVSESIDVVIRGTEEQLSSLKAENIRAVADLTDYKDSVGTYMPQVKIYVDSSVDLGPIGSYTITVEITQ